MEYMTVPVKALEWEVCGGGELGCNYNLLTTEYRVPICAGRCNTVCNFNFYTYLKKTFFLFGAIPNAINF
jgi:hypothetical protein